MGITGENIRNIAVIGHSGEGKTTLCEAMLFNGGTTDRQGKVLDGTTVTDFDDLEKAKKMSMYTACAYLMWKGVKINLLDLPGFYDFEGERHEGLRAAGGALLVIGANGVLPIGAESVVDYCLRLGKPLIIFINGMDKENADYFGTVRALKEKYAGKLAPIQIPIMENGKMQGCINALQEKAYRFTQDGVEEIPVPDDLKAQVEEMQANLMETAAENDEVLLDKYFEAGSLTHEETVHGIRLGIASVNTIPVMAGSALQNRGVINLLNEIVEYMPQANERVTTLATDLAADKVVNVLPEENAAPRGAGVQDRHRPLFGQAQLLKSIPRHFKERQRRLERKRRKGRTHRTDLPAQRQKDGACRRACGGRYRRGEQTQRHRHLRHPLRSERENKVRPHPLPQAHPVYGGFVREKGRGGQSVRGT